MNTFMYLLMGALVVGVLFVIIGLAIKDNDIRKAGLAVVIAVAVAIAIASLINFLGLLPQEMPFEESSGIHMSFMGFWPEQTDPCRDQNNDGQNDNGENSYNPQHIGFPAVVGIGNNN